MLYYFKSYTKRTLVFLLFYIVISGYPWMKIPVFGALKPGLLSHRSQYQKALTHLRPHYTYTNQRGFPLDKLGVDLLSASRWTCSSGQTTPKLRSSRTGKIEKVAVNVDGRPLCDINSGGTIVPKKISSTAHNIATFNFGKHLTRRCIAVIKAFHPIGQAC
jgi:hypothetical protein